MPAVFGVEHDDQRDCVFGKFGGFEFEGWFLSDLWSLDLIAFRLTMSGRGFLLQFWRDAMEYSRGGPDKETEVDGIPIVRARPFIRDAKGGTPLS